MPTTTLLRALDPVPEDHLGRVRARALALARDDGHTPLLFPDLCLYRYSAPTIYTKAATFGVTLGVVLQGRKRIRFGAHEVSVDPSRVVVVTRESEHRSSVLEATEQRPYVGLSLCFGPERVARALLALGDAGGPAAPRETAPAFSMACDAALADAIERLVAATDDALDRRMLAPLVMDEILYRLLRSEAAAAVRAGVGPAADATRILETMRFLREHHAEKLSVERLARHAGMSPSHFAHRFRAGSAWG
jgi:hypothetical protein